MIEAFGGKEYAVRGCPPTCLPWRAKDLLLEMIDGLSEDTAIHKPDMIWDKVASMSCKAAVKGRHAMSPREAGRADQPASGAGKSVCLPPWEAHHHFYVEIRAGKEI